jgi:hypothetical protein
MTQSAKADYGETLAADSGDGAGAAVLSDTKPTTATGLSEAVKLRHPSPRCVTVTVHLVYPEARAAPPHRLLQPESCP